MEKDDESIPIKWAVTSKGQILTKKMMHWRHILYFEITWREGGRGWRWGIDKDRVGGWDHKKTNYFCIFCGSTFTCLFSHIAYGLWACYLSFSTHMQSCSHDIIYVPTSLHYISFSLTFIHIYIYISDSNTCDTGYPLFNTLLFKQVLLACVLI